MDIMEFDKLQKETWKSGSKCVRKWETKEFCHCDVNCSEILNVGDSIRSVVMNKGTDLTHDNTLDQRFCTVHGLATTIFSIPHFRQMKEQPPEMIESRFPRSM